MRLLLIVMILPLITASFARAQDIDIHGYAFRKQSYNSWYFTDMGMDARIYSGNAQIRYRRGIMFGTRSKTDIGNHQFKYNRLNLYFRISQDLWIGGGILTEIEPFEENDLGLNGYNGMQMMEIGIGPFTVSRKKWTNSFYSSDYLLKLLEIDFLTKTQVWGRYKTYGERGKGTVFNLEKDKPYYIETGISQRWHMNIEKIGLTIILLYSLKKDYTTTNRIDSGYGIGLMLSNITY